MNDSYCSVHVFFTSSFVCVYGCHVRNGLYVSLLRKRIEKKNRTDAIQCTKQWTWTHIWMWFWLDTQPATVTAAPTIITKWVEKKKFHTKHIKIFRRNEIIYHIPCGRVATDPFLNRFACMLYFLWHFNKQIFYTIHTHNKRAKKGVVLERRKKISKE